MLRPSFIEVLCAVSAGPAAHTFSPAKSLGPSHISALAPEKFWPPDRLPRLGTGKGIGGRKKRLRGQRMVMGASTAQGLHVWPGPSWSDRQHETET